jgi:S-adenosylmethionine hydrolase
MFAYPGSSGYIEIGINQGNAAFRLGCASGQSVTLVRSRRRQRQSEKAEKAV